MSTKEKTLANLETNYKHKYDAYIERQKRKKQRLFRRLMLFSIVVLITFGSMAAYHFKQRSIQAEKAEQYEQLEGKLADLKKEEKNLNEEIKLLNNEEYVLEIARTNYFFSKKGELIFNLPDEEPSY
ncbi:FtsB family cell division protein [Virgibacillus siamensis]|uniref:FtsB family cell division protein n=1 Tax=Virgibacillus siamensis TaxID=480071 RepID=UPI000985A740|nr:septum formation initiator family protein [Virgibacillus siamensis]